MGATKENNYLNEELTISLIGRAISHPARVKILNKLFEEQTGSRSVDLAKWLNFSKPTMKEHLDKMKDAKIIEIDYFPHFYRISLNSNGIQLAKSMLVK